jgi:hypothetical protein
LPSTLTTWWSEEPAWPPEPILIGNECRRAPQGQDPRNSWYWLWISLLPHLSIYVSPRGNMDIVGVRLAAMRSMRSLRPHTRGELAR